MANISFQVLLSGLLQGSLYGLAGAGLHLIMAATGQVHLAYGHLWVAAGLAAAALIHAGLPLGPAIAAVAFAWAAGAWALHPKALWEGRPAADGQRSFFLATLGMALIIEDIGGRLAPLPVSALDAAPRPIEIAGLVIAPARAATLALLALLCVGLVVFLRTNRWGLALRAWDGGTGPLWTVGVDPAGLGRRLMAICLGLAGLAGGLLCLGHSLAIQEGMAMTMRCCCVAAAGGFGLGAILAAGLGLGLAEAVVGQVCGTRWMAIVPVVLVVLMLHMRRITSPWRPQP